MLEICMKNTKLHREFNTKYRPLKCSSTSTHKINSSSITVCFCWLCHASEGIRCYHPQRINYLSRWMLFSMKIPCTFLSLNFKGNTRRKFKLSTIVKLTGMWLTWIQLVMTHKLVKSRDE